MVVNLIAVYWQAMKSQRARYLLVVMAAFVIGCLYSPFVVIMLCVGLGITYPGKLFMIEDKARLHDLYICLPVSRRQIVTGRYLFSLLVLAFSVLVGLVLTVLSGIIIERINIMNIQIIGITAPMLLYATLVSYAFYALYILSMYPFQFRLGYMNGRFFGFFSLLGIVVACIIGLPFLLTIGDPQLFDLLVDFVQHKQLYFCGVAVSIISLLVILSYLLSVRCYTKRDF